MAWDPWSRDNFRLQGIMGDDPLEPDPPPDGGITGPQLPRNDFPIDGRPTQDGGPQEGPGGGFEFGGGGPERPPFSPNWNVPNAPDFNAPKFSWDPSGIYSDPSYQFRLKNSLGAMQNSAAAKGLLRTGMTFKDLSDYAGNSASQELSNTFGRALSVYDREYQGAKDMYAPKFATWEHKDYWGQKAAQLALANMWADYFHNTVSADAAFGAGLE